MNQKYIENSIMPDAKKIVNFTINMPDGKHKIRISTLSLY